MPPQATIDATVSTRELYRTVTEKGHSPRQAFSDGTVCFCDLPATGDKLAAKAKEAEQVKLPCSDGVSFQARAARHNGNLKVQFQCPAISGEDVTRQALMPCENTQTTPKSAGALFAARGMLTLGMHADQPSGATALCIVKNKVLMLVLKTAPKAFSDETESENYDKVLARIPISNLEVTLRPGKTNLFQVNTKGHHDDGVFCFAKDQTDRNKWIAVFRRMEVAIFADLDGHRQCLQPLAL
jgi:hypothetical protein